jgi:quercetin dioxygenase-like cupin family protein
MLSSAAPGGHPYDARMDRTAEIAAFEAAARAAGYTDILDREWAPGQVVGEHTHPFDVQALVTRGEVWLTVGEQTRHLRAGDRFDLARECPHTERYGPEGATFRAARRH